jgi:hypothetical protein
MKPGIVLHPVRASIGQADKSVSVRVSNNPDRPWPVSSGATGLAAFWATGLMSQPGGRRPFLG